MAGISRVKLLADDSGVAVDSRIANRKPEYRVSDHAAMSLPRSHRRPTEVLGAV